jgi:hypothetical protein
MLSTKGTRWSAFIFLAGFTTAVFVCHYVLNEDPAYLWDWGGYFIFYKDFGERILSGDHSWLPDLLRSIRADDYNPSGVIPLTIFYAIFGKSRVGYILGIVLLYLIPTVLIASALAAHAAKTSSLRIGKPEAALIFGAGLLFPPFWASTMRGMVDIVGLIPLGCATFIVIRSRFFAEGPLKSAVMVGLLIWSAFLLRRWYAYAAFGLITASALITLWYICCFDNRRERIVSAAIVFTVIGATLASALMLFQSTLVVKILSTSYREAYAGYQAPFSAQLAVLYNRLGPALALASIVGVGLAVAKRNIAIVFCAIASIITFLAFSTTQAPGIQHTLPIYFWLFPAVGYVFALLASRLSSHSGAAASAALMLILAANFLAVFSEPVRAKLSWAGALFPRETIFPLKIENFPQYRRAIGALLELTDKEGEFAVFASGYAMSDSLLMAIDDRLRPKLVWSSQVDARDGLRLAPLRAKYAVVTYPITLHLRPEAQRVVSVVASSILNRSGVGEAYEKLLGPYDIAEGRQAFIFKRTRGFSEYDIEHLVELFQQFYPGWSWDGWDTIKLGISPRPQKYNGTMSDSR